jgi:hypothetical protein
LSSSRFRCSAACSRRFGSSGSHAVTALVPREDQTPERRIFQGFGGDRFRTAITRACVAACVPTFSPHDLRHRRISLLHLGGVPGVRIGEHVGQRTSPSRRTTYTHVLIDETELDTPHSSVGEVGRRYGRPSGVFPTQLQVQTMFVNATPKALGSSVATVKYVMLRGCDRGR